MPLPCSAVPKPAMVRSSKGSTSPFTHLNGVSQRPRSTEPARVARPTPLLRFANVVLFSSGLNCVSSWKKAFTPGASVSVPFTPTNEAWSAIRVRLGTGAAPSFALTDSAVTNTRPYSTTGSPSCATAAGTMRAAARARTTAGKRCIIVPSSAHERYAFGDVVALQRAHLVLDLHITRGLL